MLIQIQCANLLKNHFSPNIVHAKYHTFTLIIPSRNLIVAKRVVALLLCMCVCMCVYVCMCVHYQLFSKIQRKTSHECSSTFVHFFGMVKWQTVLIRYFWNYRKETKLKPEFYVCLEVDHYHIQSNSTAWYIFGFKSRLKKQTFCSKGGLEDCL